MLDNEKPNPQHQIGESGQLTKETAPFHHEDELSLQSHTEELLETIISGEFSEPLLLKELALIDAGLSGAGYLPIMHGASLVTFCSSIRGLMHTYQQLPEQSQPEPDELTPIRQELASIKSADFKHYYNKMAYEGVNSQHIRALCASISSTADLFTFADLILDNQERVAADPVRVVEFEGSMNPQHIGHRLTIDWLLSYIPDTTVAVHFTRGNFQKPELDDNYTQRLLEGELALRTSALLRQHPVGKIAYLNMGTIVSADGEYPSKQFHLLADLAGGPDSPVKIAWGDENLAKIPDLAKSPEQEHRVLAAELALHPGDTIYVLPREGRPEAYLRAVLHDWGVYATGKDVADVSVLPPKPSPEEIFDAFAPFAQQTISSTILRMMSQSDTAAQLLHSGDRSDATKDIVLETINRFKGIETVTDPHQEQIRDAFPLFASQLPHFDEESFLDRCLQLQRRGHQLILIYKDDKPVKGAVIKLGHNLKDHGRPYIHPILISSDLPESNHLISAELWHSIIKHAQEMDCRAIEFSHQVASDLEQFSRTDMTASHYTFEMNLAKHTYEITAVVHRNDLSPETADRIANIKSRITIKHAMTDQEILDCYQPMLRVRDEKDLGTLEEFLQTIRHLQKNGCTLLILYLDAQPLATLTYEYDETFDGVPTMFPHEMGAINHPDTKGISSTLLWDVAISEALEKGMTQIRFDSGKVRSGAHRAHERNGFKITGNYYTQNIE